MKSIGRLYLEAMAPALEGYQDVVMDRCWTSEAIYGLVHRGGVDRLGVASRRMLERVAMRCNVGMLLYLPPLETCLANFRKRRGAEYLDSEVKLERVWGAYKDRALGNGIHRLTDLRLTVVDYTRHDVVQDANNLGDTSLAHEVAWTSAGPRSTAKVILVGESFGPRKEADGLAQYPFVSFSNHVCSQWLTRQLEDHDLMERDLLWVNALEPGAETFLTAHPNLPRVALGDMAFTWLCEHDRESIAGRVTKVRHPQHVKRFDVHRTYELIARLKELLHD